MVSALTALLSVLAGPRASAQTRSTTTTSTTTPSLSRAVTVIPPNVQLDAQPGTSNEHTVAVENNADVPQRISVSVRNFKPQAEDGQAAPTDEESTYSMQRWMSVTPAAPVLQPGARQEFTVRIAVPGNAEPGSHFGAVVFTPSIPNSVSSGFVTTTEVTSLFLLRVPGAARQEAVVASFDATVTGAKRGPVDFEYRLTNSGSVHFTPKGNVIVKDLLGRKVATIPVNVEAHPVLPGATRRLTARWNAGFLVGKYTASLQLQYPSNVDGEPPKSLEASTSFTVVPDEVVIGVSVALLLVVLLLFVRRRNKRRPRKFPGRHFAR